MKRKNVGAMGLKGGHRENFFFCLLEYYYEKDRWFLSGLHQVNEVANESRRVGNDESILQWISENQLQQLVVDFPLTPPACESCLPGCQGIENCLRPEVQLVKKKICDLLEEDHQKILSNPKKYENERREDEQVTNILDAKSVVTSPSNEHILSRPFKRRLKKGFLPYWNRPVDYWVWTEYYDQMLTYLNISYDSYGSCSLMLNFHFNYLRRRLPSNLKLYETPVPIILLELMRSKIITPKTLFNLTGTETCWTDRLHLIREVEKRLKVFIYDHDIEVLVKNPKAFHSFLLALAGQRLLLNETKILPTWSLSQESHFLVPQF